MAHQCPLISIPRKSTGDADWAGPLRSTIAHSYGESPDGYAEEISVLQRCRQDAVRGAGSDTTARDLLYKYFGQLELLELRFAEIKVSFAWNDAFTTKLTTQTSLAFEKASIIHLLSAVLSTIASTSSRADPEGLKRAYFNSRATAGMLTYINENFLHAPSTDLSREVIHLLIGLSLAQATEIFMEKLVDEKKAASLIARTANQVASMYLGLVEEMKDFQGKGVFDRNWMTVLQIKASLFGSYAQYYRSLADSAAGKHGAALVRMKLADLLAQEAQRLGGAFAYSFVASSTPTLPHDAGTTLGEITKSHKTMCSEAKAQAIRDNDLIYHDILPSEATLPAIDKLPPATPVTIQEVYGSPDVSKLIGPDIFARLIPLAVHESASIYSEEKAKLIRSESERVELSEVEVRAALEHLGLPAAANEWRRLADGDDDSDDVDISTELIRVSNEIAQNGVNDARVRELEQERAQSERELRDLGASLDNESRECERMRAKYSPNFTQSPSGPQTGHFRSNLSSNLASLTAASASDDRIFVLWRENKEDIAVLASGPDALRSRAREIAAGKDQPPPVIPAGMSLLDLQDEEPTAVSKVDETERDELRKGAQDVTEKLDRLGKIRRERDDVLKDLKEKLQSDDVSNLLLLNRRTQNVEPQLFATELEKFRPYQSRIGAAVQASKTIVQELEALVAQVQRGRGIRDRAKGTKERTRRVREWERKLERAAVSHADILDGLNKALVFYSGLKSAVADLKREVKTFVTSRESERNRLVSDIETRNRLAGSAPPPPSRTGLDNQMASLSLGGYGSSAPPPLPPPSSSRSPPPHQAYSNPSYTNSPPASSSPYPPPPPKPQSPPAASSPTNNPYDFGSLSNLHSAFSTAPPQSAPPASTPSAPAHFSSLPPPPQAPRQEQQRQGSYSSYPAYPAFPSAPTTNPYSSASPGAPSSTGSSPYPPPPPRPSTQYPSYPPPGAPGQPQSPYSPPPAQSYQSPSQYQQPPPPRPAYAPPPPTTQYQHPLSSQSYYPATQQQQQLPTAHSGQTFPPPPGGQGGPTYPSAQQAQGSYQGYQPPPGYQGYQPQQQAPSGYPYH